MFSIPLEDDTVLTGNGTWQLKGNPPYVCRLFLQFILFQEMLLQGHARQP